MSSGFFPSCLTCCGRYAMNEMPRCVCVIVRSVSEREKSRQIDIHSHSHQDSHRDNSSVSVFILHRKDAAGKLHQVLPNPGFDYGHCWTASLLHRHLCASKFLGLFCNLWSFAHLPQPGIMDILVHWEPDCVGRRAQPGQTGHTVMSTDRDGNELWTSKVECGCIKNTQCIQATLSSLSATSLWLLARIRFTSKSDSTKRSV